MPKPKPKSNKYQELIKERDKLYVSGKNPKRLTEIISKINYFEYGINKTLECFASVAP